MLTFQQKAVLLAFAAVAWLPACNLEDVGCTTDDECVQGRVCVAGTCQWPGGVEPDFNGVANNAVSNNIASNNSGANSATANNVVANNIATNNVSANNIATNNVSANNIATNNVSANNIATNNVSPNNLNDQTPYGRSCEDIRRNYDGELESGFYTIEADFGSDMEVFCLFDEADRGWTLVARSAVQASQQFGWQDNFGDVRDFGGYSLEVRRAGLQFTEILLAQRDPDRPNLYDLDGEAYIVRPIPGAFASNWIARTTPELDVLREAGTCPVSQVNAFRFFGYVSRGWIFMGATPELTGTGLYDDGYEFGEGDEPTCYSGRLHGTQGLVYVR